PNMPLTAGAGLAALSARDLHVALKHHVLARLQPEAGDLDRGFDRPVRPDEGQRVRTFRNPPFPGHRVTLGGVRFRVGLRRVAHRLHGDDGLPASRVGGEFGWPALFERTVVAETNG